MKVSVFGPKDGKTPQGTGGKGKLLPAIIAIAAKAITCLQDLRACMHQTKGTLK